MGVFVLGLGLMAAAARTRMVGPRFSPAFWLVAAVLTADWLYAVADIALASSRAQANPSENDGWQV